MTFYLWFVVKVAEVATHCTRNSKFLLPLQMKPRFLSEDRVFLLALKIGHSCILRRKFWPLKVTATIVMQEASDALSKLQDSDTVSIYQFSSAQLVTDKKLEAFDKA